MHGGKLNLRELALREATLTLRLNSTKDELKSVREATQRALEQTNKENGTRQISVTLRDGTQVGTISLNEDTREAAVIDEEALKEWISRNYPGEIQRKLVAEIRPAFLSRLLADVTRAGTVRVADTETGEIQEIPGVEIRVARRGTHALRFKDNDAREAVRASQPADRPPSQPRSPNNQPH